MPTMKQLVSVVSLVIQLVVPLAILPQSAVLPLQVSIGKREKQGGFEQCWVIATEIPLLQPF